MNIKPKRIFVPVDKEPEFMQDWVLLLHGELDKNYSCTLKEENKYTFSADELKKFKIALAKDVFDAGYDYRSSLLPEVIDEFGENSKPDFEQYIKHLNL